MFITPFNITKNTKILMTQYKIMHRIIAVNLNLKKWKGIDYSTCELCDKEDTIEHFIYECKNTKNLWLSILTWWENAFEFTIPITIMEIIFGVPNENDNEHINFLNAMILYPKHYSIHFKEKKQ
jgi:hypothetical protein